MFDAHVRPGEHARNLFEVAAEESVSAANERLEGNRLTLLVQVNLAVKKDALAISCHLLQQRVSTHVFA